MKKPIKIALYSIGGLIALIVIIIIVAVTVIDPNAYKGQIEKLASQQIQRDLRIGGDIDLSFFPWIGVNIQDVSLANAKGFPKEHFATVSSLGVKVKLLPLLSQNIQVGGFELKGFTLNLSTDEKGRTNWEDLAGKPAAPSKAEPSAKQQPSALPALEVQKVDISQGTINWSDKSTGTQLQLNDLRLNAGPVQMGQPFSFTFGFRMDNAKPQIAMKVEGKGKVLAEMQKQSYSLNDFQLSARFEGPAIPAGQGELTLNTDARADLAAAKASLENFSARTYGLELSGAASAENITKTPSLQGSMQLAKFNPKDLLQRLGQTPPSTRDKNALTSAQAQMEFSGSPTAIRISKLTANLDETSLTGQMAVENMAQPAVDLTLEMDTLNVDRYMPPQAEKKKPQEAEKAPEPEKKQAGLELEPLRKLDLDGQIDIQELIVQKIKMHNVALTLSAHNGLVEIKPLKADLYEGTLHTSTTLDVRKNTPVIQVDKKLSGVNISPLLKDLVGRNPLTGKLNFEGDMKTTGLSTQDWLKNVDGDLSFLMDGGTIQGLNIANLLYNKIRAVQGKQPETAQTNTTEFTQLEAAAKLRQGMARESHVSLLSPLLQLDGSGSFDLVKQILDYSMKAEFTEKFQKQTGLGLDKAGAITVPISLSGSFADPKYSVNVKSLIQDLGRKKIKEQLQKQLFDKSGEDSKEDQSSKKLDPKKLLEGVFKSQ